MHLNVPDSQQHWQMTLPPPHFRGGLCIGLITSNAGLLTLNWSSGCQDLRPMEPGEKTLGGPEDHISKSSFLCPLDLNEQLTLAVRIQCHCKGSFLSFPELGFKHTYYMTSAVFFTATNRCFSLNLFHSITTHYLLSGNIIALYNNFLFIQYKTQAV